MLAFLVQEAWPEQELTCSRVLVFRIISVLEGEQLRHLGVL